jgi:predicted aldo/keto reductase-like oxidoreductase
LKKITLGKTNLKVSLLGFGGIPITRVSPKDAIKTIRYALDKEINFIDTANSYGNSEEKIGKAIKGYKRENIILATKTASLSPKEIKRHLNLSLKRLKTGYIDLYQFHHISTNERYQELIKNKKIIDTFLKAKKEGKIRHIGMTSHSLKIALRLLSLEITETIMFPFNFISNEALTKLIPKVRKKNIGFICMKPFGGGKLENAKLNLRFIQNSLKEKALIIPGMSNINEVKENISIINKSKKLTILEKKQINKIKNKSGKNFCRKCLYCMPCPEGIEIYLANDISVLIKRFPIKDIKSGWVKDIMSQAKKCTECGLCRKKCPYNLPIPEMLKKSVKRWEKIRQLKI